MTGRRWPIAEDRRPHVARATSAPSVALPPRRPIARPFPPAWGGGAGGFVPSPAPIRAAGL